MDDDIETAEPDDETPVEETPDAPTPEPELDQPAGSDQPAQPGQSVDDDEAGVQPEPTPVGHGIVQDNVTQEGVQTTKTADGTVTGETTADDLAS